MLESDLSIYPIKTNRKLAIGLSLFILFFGLAYYLYGLAPNDLRPLVQQNSQNAFDYVSEDKLLLPADKQAQFYQDFIKNYFALWDDQRSLAYVSKTKALEEQLLSTYAKHSYWGINNLPLKEDWLTTIQQNMELSNFPNALAKAITTQSTSVRVLPTADPAFKDINQPGEGYPFDTLQASYLPASMPIKVLQLSQDKAWALIISANATGWIHSTDLAYVDTNFMQKWQTGKYLVAIHDRIPIVDEAQHYQFNLRLGMILPLMAEDQTTYQVLRAIADSNQKAIIKPLTIAKEHLASMPMPLTRQNIAKLLNELMGQPYGWGDLNGYRDCSSSLHNVFSVFGIKLPRVSSHQIQVGRYFSLAGMTNQQKYDLLQQQGVPWLTLIWQPGHIMLYLGEQHDKSYIFHTASGLRTKTWGQEGRAKIGQTVITPLDIGKQYTNIPVSYIDKIQAFTILDQV